MRLRQYVHFTLYSDSFTPEQITAHVGIEPDRVWVRGSRRLEPTPVPRHHMWEISCDTRHVSLGQQIESVLGRVAAAQEKIRDLVAANADVSAQLSAMRAFADEDGDYPVIRRDESGAVVDWASLFGWSMSVENIRVLAYVGASFWVDEYDLSDDECPDAPSSEAHPRPPSPRA